MGTGDFSWLMSMRPSQIRLDCEGQAWGLKSPEEYAGLPNNIVRLSDRLKIYLSGIEGDFFERPPAR